MGLMYVIQNLKRALTKWKIFKDERQKMVKKISKNDYSDRLNLLK